MKTSIFMVLLLVGFVISQFGVSRSTKKPGWVRSKVTRLQEFIGIRQRTTTMPYRPSRTTTSMPNTSPKSSFLDRVFGRGKTTTRTFPNADPVFRRTTTVFRLTTVTPKSFFDHVIRQTTTPFSTTQKPLDGQKSILSRVFDKIKGLFGSGSASDDNESKIKKYGMKAVQKLAPILLKKIKENFHGFNSFFSTDEEFPTQLQNFEGNTQKDLRELKTKVERLEKLVEGLQMTLLESWNSTESGTRYKLFEERKNWDDAEKHCQSFGGHLVVVDNDDRNSYVKELLQTSSQTADFAWIGMKTKTTTHTSTFTNFASENPIDGCAVIDKQGVWAIRSCVQLRPFICQIVKSV